jgi:hypothetical protein
MAKKADTDGEAKSSEGEAKPSEPDRLMELTRAQQQELRAQAERSMRTHEQVDMLIKQMAELRADVAELLEHTAELLEHTRALHVQRPRSLTKTEVEQLLKAKPDQSYIVCAPFSAGSLSFRPGDRIDARTRFSNPDHLALHVERGLQLTIPPQA